MRSTTPWPCGPHNNGLEFACIVEDEVPHHVVGDPMRLRQVITNLVGNSIKFTTEGHVAIRVKVVSKAGHDITLGFEISGHGDRHRQGEPEWAIRGLHPSRLFDDSQVRGHGTRAGHLAPNRKADGRQDRPG